MIKRAKIILYGDMWKCSICPNILFNRIGDAQTHMLDFHPRPKKAKAKPLTIVQATRKEKLRHPTPTERADIRQAIKEAKTKRLPLC